MKTVYARTHARTHTHTHTHTHTDITFVIGIEEYFVFGVFRLSCQWCVHEELGLFG